MAKNKSRKYSTQTPAATTQASSFGKLYRFLKECAFVLGFLGTCMAFFPAIVVEIKPSVKGRFYDEFWVKNNSIFPVRDILVITGIYNMLDETQKISGNNISMISGDFGDIERGEDLPVKIGGLVSTPHQIQQGLLRGGSLSQEIANSRHVPIDSQWIKADICMQISFRYSIWPLTLITLKEYRGYQFNQESKAYNWEKRSFICDTDQRKADLEKKLKDAIKSRHFQVI